MIGSCENMCYWVDDYNCAGLQCPNGNLFPLVDSRGALFKAGDCVDWDAQESYTDLPIFAAPPYPLSVRGWYYTVNGVQGAVALRTYTDPGCAASRDFLMGYSPYMSYLPGFCFSSSSDCFSGISVSDAQTFKVQECEAACQPDGYGCGNNANGVFDVIGLPQLQCPNTQGCLGNCPTAQISLVTCLGIQISGFGFQPSGVCACSLIPKDPAPPPDDHPLVLHARNTTLNFMKNMMKLLPVYPLKEEKKQKRDIPNTGCSLGVALVLDVGQQPIIQLNELQPLVIPPLHVIFGAVYEITPDTPYDASLIPFIYNSKDDPTWVPLQMNQGDRIILLSIFECGNITTDLSIDYDGNFNFLIQ